MSTDRKVCCLCGRPPFRSHNCPCPKPPGPYRLEPISSSPHQQYSAAKLAWLQSNPEASPEQIEAEAQRIAERLGV